MQRRPAFPQQLTRVGVGWDGRCLCFVCSWQRRRRAPKLAVIRLCRRIGGLTPRRSRDVHTVDPEDPNRSRGSRAATGDVPWAEPPAAAGLAAGPLSAASSAAVVEVIDRTGRLGTEQAARLRVALGAVLGLLGCAGEVRVGVVNDEAMARLHAEHLSDPTTTDVLTFDMSEGASAATRFLDLDAVVCLDEAARQSAARSHSVADELLLYAVHAVLHALGHDDHDPGAAAAMHAAEDRLLSAVGVGAVYGRPDSQTRSAAGAAGGANDRGAGQAGGAP
ncbi:MAG: rRNA maturation RNase YbeY [Planctomyces sp.]|nr:rRNA maturation RNase YbeY [Planctomyces sp.]